MGKASRNKQKQPKPAAAAITADAALEWFEALPRRWVLGDEGEFAALTSGPIGLVSPVFDTEAAADAFREEADLSVPVRQIGALSAFIEDMARAGVVTLVDDEHGIHATAACRLEEVSRTTPSYLAVGPFAAPRAAVMRTGRITKNPAAPLFSWMRFDLTDASVASALDTRATSPFMGHEPGTPLWEQRTLTGTPLFSSIIEHGPWPTKFGTFAFFTDHTDADDFVSSGHCGRMAWVHLTQHVPIERPRTMAVPCLLTRIMELLPAAGFTPFVINTGGARSEVAFGTIGQPYLRTVAGVWEILRNNHFRYLHPWSNWSRSDTFHWAGGPGLVIETLNRSFSPRPTIDATELAEEERDDLVDAALAAGPMPPGEILDGYLLVMHDTVDHCRSTWRVFPSHTSCCAWLQRFESDIDLPARIRGLDPPVELGFPAGDARQERAASTAFQASVRRLARKGLLEPYRTQDGHDLAAMSAMVLRTQRVHAAGYIRDLAVEGRSDDGWLTDLVDVLGDDGRRLLAWLDETDALRIDAPSATRLRDRLGAPTWDALDLRSRHFLATALRLLDDHRGHNDLDLSGVAVECCKALEVELSHLVGTFRDHPDSELPHDPDDRNDTLLRSFLDRTDKLTLGNFGRLLRPAAGTSPLRLALNSHIRGLPGGDHLTHRNFASSFLTKVGNKRNPASHDTPTGWDEANDMFELVIGGGSMTELVRWKVDATPRPAPARSRLRADDGQLRAEIFRFDQPHPTQLSDGDDDGDDEIGALLDAADSISPEFGALVRDVSRSHLEQEAARSGGVPLGSVGLPVLQRAIASMVSDPILERLQVPGLIGQDAREIAWRIIPGMLLGRTETGIVVQFALAHSGIEGDAHDMFQNTYDESTMTSMAAFLANRDQDLWIARRGALVLQRAGAPTQQRITMLLRRSRPPGGYLPVYLSATAIRYFEEIVTDLAARRYGPLRAPESLN